MKASFQTRRTCRLCGSGNLSLCLPMVPTPIGDNYLTGDRLGSAEEVFNLDLMFCEGCGQVQLRDVVAPDLLYPEFPYVTSVSAGLPEHFRRFAADIVARHRIERASLVIEIGSNEGPMLRAFKEQGCRVLGVEPATAIAKAATQGGVPTLARYFDSALAGEILAEHGPATVVAAANVLANIDDLDDVMRGVARLLSPDGLLVMETSYWADVLAKGLIDTIYHEHISYFSAGPLQGFLRRHGLEIIQIDRNPNKGGSIRLTAQRRGGRRPVDLSVEQTLAFEAAAGLRDPLAFAACGRRIAGLRDGLHRLLGGSPAVRNAGYGASVGTTTMLHQFELGSRLSRLYDDNSRKHGKFSPGLHLPCLPANEIDRGGTDLLVVFAWRFLDQILARHPALGTGRSLLLPLPEARAIPP